MSHAHDPSTRPGIPNDPWRTHNVVRAMCVIAPHARCIPYHEQIGLQALISGRSLSCPFPPHRVASHRAQRLVCLSVSSISLISLRPPRTHQLLTPASISVISTISSIQLHPCWPDLSGCSSTSLSKVLPILLPSCSFSSHRCEAAIPDW